MKIAKYLRVALIVAAVAIHQQLAAQLEATSTESGIADQVETTPSTEITPAAVSGTARDDGSALGGSEVAGAVFDLPRQIHASVNLIGGYDDNVNLTPFGSPSWYSSVNGHFAYAFGTHRLAMFLIAGAGITYYFDHPGGRDYDPNFHLRLSLAYRITPRLAFNATVFAAYQSQPDFSSELSANRRLGNFFRTGDTISLDYRLTPRWSIASNYTLAIVNYESSIGAFQNRIEQSFGESLRYLWLPTTSLNGEYRFTTINYESAPRDSTGHLLTVGLDHTFDPHWGALVRAGVQFRISDENVMNRNSAGNRTSPYVEGIVRYIFEPNTLLVWTNRLSIEESDLPQDQGPSFRTHLQLNYGITARISANLQLSYLHREGTSSGSLSSGENVFDIGPSVRYKITRYVGIDVGYRYSKADRGSNLGGGTGQDLGGSHSRNRYFAGLNISF